jgi:tetrahydromethanopterin S-methyltransferase subunit F
MKVIVLIVIVITMYGCGIKTKVSCNVDDINTVIDDCKKQPQVGISKEF